LKVSVIVSTYNRPDALELTIVSLVRQSHLPSEIIISDDGSTSETEELIQKLNNEIDIPIIHCWQEDKGFRLARARNLALNRCRYQYVIQIDGDIITHPKFIEDHLSYAKPGVYLAGRRITLTLADTQNCLEKGVLEYKDKSATKLTHRLRSKLLMEVCKPSVINKLINKGVFGCNISYWLKDALSINGYNENFEGWGKEDDEFAFRMLHSGIKRKTMWFGALQYHLEHPPESRERLETNTQMYSDLLKS